MPRPECFRVCDVKFAHEEHLERMVEARGAGFPQERMPEYNGSFFFAPRYLSHMFMITFDMDDWHEARPATVLLDVLVGDAAAEAYGEYRAHLAHMGLIAQQYDLNDGAMGRFDARIKAALDPLGVLSPGKHGSWPAGAPWPPSSDGTAGNGYPTSQSVEDPLQ